MAQPRLGVIRGRWRGRASFTMQPCCRTEKFWLLGAFGALKTQTLSLPTQPILRKCGIRQRARGRPWQALQLFGYIMQLLCCCPTVVSYQQGATLEELQQKSTRRRIFLKEPGQPSARRR